MWIRDYEKNGADKNLMNKYFEIFDNSRLKKQIVSKAIYNYGIIFLSCQQGYH